MNLVAGFVGRNQCSLAMTNSVELGKKTGHHPAGLVKLWHDPAPRASSSPGLSSLSMNLHFLPLLPAKDLPAASPPP